MKVRKWVLAAVASVALIGLPRQASAQDLDKEIAGAADTTRVVLTDLGADEVMLGEFAPRGGTRSNFGPEIRRVLTAELAKRGIKVVKKAAYELAGNYGPSKDGEGAETFIRINLQMHDSKTGKTVPELNGLTIDVKNDNVKLAEAAGATVKLDPTATFGERNAVIAQAIDKPGPGGMGGNPITPPGGQGAGPTFTTAGKLNVEILVVDAPDAADPKTGRELRTDCGQPFVDLKSGEFYRLKLTNTADFDMAVAIGIDGIDQYAFINEQTPGVEAGGKPVPMRDPKTGKSLYTHVLVAKGATVIVRGWFRDLKTVDAFSVTEYAKGAAAELGGAGPVGQIVIKASASWDKDADAPADEKGTKDGSVATGRGPEIKQEAAAVVRKVGAVREIVTVRYSKETPATPTK